MKYLSMRLYAVLFLVLSVTACVHPVFEDAKPETPRQAIAYGYATIKELAAVVTIAKRDGHIDSDKRDKLVGELQKAKNNLVLAEVSVKNFESTQNPAYENDAEARLNQAESILSLVEALLQEDAR